MNTKNRVIKQWIQKCRDPFQCRRSALGKRLHAQSTGRREISEGIFIVPRCGF